MPNGWNELVFMWYFQVLLSTQMDQPPLTPNLESTAPPSPEVEPPTTVCHKETLPAILMQLPGQLLAGVGWAVRHFL